MDKRLSPRETESPKSTTRTTATTGASSSRLRCSSQLTGTADRPRAPTLRRSVTRIQASLAHTSQSSNPDSTNPKGIGTSKRHDAKDERFVTSTPPNWDKALSDPKFAWGVTYAEANGIPSAVPVPYRPTSHVSQDCSRSRRPGSSVRRDGDSEKTRVRLSASMSQGAVREYTTLAPGPPTARSRSSASRTLLDSPRTDIERWLASVPKSPSLKPMRRPRSEQSDAPSEKLVAKSNAQVQAQAQHPYPYRSPGITRVTNYEEYVYEPEDDAASGSETYSYADEMRCRSDAGTLTFHTQTQMPQSQYDIEAIVRAPTPSEY